MKGKKKPLGTKAQIRAIKEKEKRIATAIFLALILIVVAFSSYLLYSFLSQSQKQSLIEPSLQFIPPNPNPQLKAAIVDHLSLTSPNQTFIDTAASILVNANYTVDYFSGEKVTVEFYRNLPTLEYRLIILRVHSTTGGQPIVAFFTSEAYNKGTYNYEQLTDQIEPVAYTSEEGSKGICYLGITQKFIASSMKGKFQNTTIIMMGCEGLYNTKMADAFIEKGAKVYMGWNGSVSASHTDTATAFLLQHLIQEKQPIKQSVENTMKEVGPDSAYNSTLSYYPLEAGEQTIENIKR